VAEADRESGVCSKIIFRERKRHGERKSQFASHAFVHNRLLDVASLVEFQEELDEIRLPDRCQLPGESLELIRDALPHARLTVEKSSVQIEENSPELQPISRR
jgi:hypothetical protein